ncbi:hypothetical protein L6452_20414 [Arctium lappa]|uniref:Uncharacterized protein n=1 Tax=Arctium lappa TaxID=4217 RepID=A0ACB9BC60_ARCLA|nr:hypothetical protein L6452_20414 [Arctium lappa]
MILNPIRLCSNSKNKISYHDVHGTFQIPLRSQMTFRNAMNIEAANLSYLMILRKKVIGVGTSTTPQETRNDWSFNQCEFYISHTRRYDKIATSMFIAYPGYLAGAFRRSLCASCQLMLLHHPWLSAAPGLMQARVLLQATSGSFSAQAGKFKILSYHTPPPASANDPPGKDFRVLSAMISTKLHHCRQPLLHRQAAAHHQFLQHLLITDTTTTTMDKTHILPTAEPHLPVSLLRHLPPDIITSLRPVVFRLCRHQNYRLWILLHPPQLTTLRHRAMVAIAVRRVMGLPLDPL